VDGAPLENVEYWCLHLTGLAENVGMKVIQKIMHLNAKSEDEKGRTKKRPKSE
jgi:hypothetical protein